MAKEITNSDIQLAIIGGPHGIKGEVRVKSFTDDPLAFGDYGKLHDKNGTKYKVVKARVSKNVVVTRFKSIDTREKAEALNGVELYVDRTCFPEVDDEDEFYLSDLDGLDCVDESGAVLGYVKGIHNFGAGDIIEVRFAKGGDAFYAFTKEIVPSVDVKGGSLVLIPPLEVSERDADVQDDNSQATLRQAQDEDVDIKPSAHRQAQVEGSQTGSKINTGPNTPREGKRKKGGN